MNTVLRNPDVALRGAWAAGSSRSGRPEPISGKGLTGYHLDFPGNALDPGCDYEKWSKRDYRGHEADRHTPTSSPDRITRASSHCSTGSSTPSTTGTTPRGHWEMIQLDFDASDAAAALETEPYQVGYSQHTGGERAAWGAAKLKLVDGTHPVVYLAAGSHANYFSVRQLFLGRIGVPGRRLRRHPRPLRDTPTRRRAVPTARGGTCGHIPGSGSSATGGRATGVLQRPDRPEH